MKDRGKSVETLRRFSDKFDSWESEMSCKKHKNPSPVGICAYCLREKLVSLMCSECGEQRLSSCSCSDFSPSYRNSCSTMEIGSVGRISFLLENDKADQSHQNLYRLNWKKKVKEAEGVILLRRSSSSCVEVKKSRGFWRIKKLFLRKRNMGFEKNGESCDDKSEIWLSDIVSRSRSLCSFRGGKQNSILDESSDFGLSSAKISDAASGIFLDSEKKFDLSNDLEPRKSGFRVENGVDFKGRSKRGSAQNLTDLDKAHIVPNSCVFPVKESEFSAMDESGFIDLKLDFLSESKKESSAAEDSDLGGFRSQNDILESGSNLERVKGDGVFDGGESCRITVNEKEPKRWNRSNRVWKWIFKYHFSVKN